MTDKTKTLVEILSDENTDEQTKHSLLELRRRLPMELSDIAIFSLLHGLPLGDGVDEYVSAMSETGRDAARSMADLGIPWLRYYVSPETPGDFDGVAFQRELVKRRLALKLEREPLEHEIRKELDDTPFSIAPGMPWSYKGGNVVIMPDKFEIMSYLSTWWTSFQTDLRNEFGMSALPNEQRIISYWDILLGWGPKWVGDHNGDFTEVEKKLKELSKWLHLTAILKHFRTERAPDLDELLILLRKYGNNDKEIVLIELANLLGVKADVSLKDVDGIDDDEDGLEDDIPFDSIEELLKEAYRHPSESLYAWLDYDDKGKEAVFHIRGVKSDMTKIVWMAQQLGMKKSEIA